MTASRDLFFLRKALALAASVSPRLVSPNPRVGCVLVKGGRVVGRGAHRRFGGPHAEIEALRRAGSRARGATAYLTLEPCVTFKGKKTGSCADALKAAGVARLVCVAKDPNPAVSGRGQRLFPDAKLAPGLSAEAEALNRGFFSRFRRGRPWTVLKTALSLDGKAATASGRSRWITGPEARAAVHRLRAECDAVLVGGGTALADDPALTAHGAGPDPLRVVLLGRRNLPKNSRLFRGIPAVVYHSRPGRSLRPVLKDLARRGVGTLLVEGGPAVHASFLREKLVDEVRVFLAPKLIGGADDPNKAPRLKDARLEKVGRDWLVEGKL